MPFGLGRKDAARRYVKGSYHTKITDSKKLSEIERVADRLEPDEEVLLVTKQTKNPMKPGGSLFTPNAVIVTNKKLIMRDPSAFGLRQKLEVFRYDAIVDIKLERGMLSAAIDINVPGLGYSRIDAISKDDAEQIQRIIQEAIRKDRDVSNQKIGESSSISDELAKLAKLRDQDIISSDEFVKMKKDLIDKM